MSLRAVSEGTPISTDGCRREVEPVPDWDLEGVLP